MYTNVLQRLILRYYMRRYFYFFRVTNVFDIYGKICTIETVRKIKFKIIRLILLFVNGYCRYLSTYHVAVARAIVFRVFL